MTPRRNTHPDPARGAVEEKAVKTYLLSAVALSLAVTASAAAAQVSDTINVATNVPAHCQSLAGISPAPVALGELADTTGHVVSTFAGDTQVSLAATYYCNGPSTISLEARPLVRTPAVPIADTASFTGEVDYLASVSWSDVTGSDDSAVDGATEILTSAAKIGELIVSVSDPSTDGNLRPVAGAYEGSVILNINVN